MITYVGENTEYPWVVQQQREGGEGDGVVSVRDIGATLNGISQNGRRQQQRPPVSMLHARIPPGASWTVEIPPDHSAIAYVREGAAVLHHPGGGTTTPHLSCGRRRHCHK